MKEEKLTSVKVIDELYRKFKEKSIRDDFSLQKLVNRSLDLFVHDEDFAKTITNYENLEESGSKYWGNMKIPKLKSVTLNSLSNKKKILLLSDDLRMSSGVGVMSREIVTGTLREFDWVQIGGAIKHPDKGKIFDLSSDLKEQFGVDDAYCKIYPVDGYGNPDLLREILNIEKPDAIMIYTYPRFWICL